jgi:uncharacterized protein (TIGR02001 family)
MGKWVRAMLRLSAVLLFFMPLVVPGVAAEPVSDNSASSIDLSGRGLLTSTYKQGGTSPTGSPLGPFDFSYGAGLTTDYIYRGTTLSAHNPSVGSAFEATFGQFYAGTTVRSVKLPANPAAEVALGSGIRPKLGNIDFDIGLTYYLYPGETPGATNGTAYWETIVRADYKISELLGVAGGLAYSPSVSNTGAWSKYAAFGLSLALPGNLMPRGYDAKLSGSAGYSWFGNQAPALGGFPLPAYANWNAGITFSRNHLNLDLRYSNTNLTKGNCFVFTGDPGALGGTVNPISNPDGRVSNWCGSAYVAKFWFSSD